MSGTLCDMYFFEPGTLIVPASGPSVADGQVITSVLVGTTGGTPKFVIYPESAPNDVDYSLRTNTTGDFTGLVPGTYIVNARTSSACLRTLKVVIGYVYNYNPRWRIRHDCVVGDISIQTRIDIEELGFTGEVEYVTCQENPHSLNFVNNSAENVFEPVIGSELVVNLIAPTDGYFDELTNSYDQRKYRASYYLAFDGGGYTKFWQGFVLPQNGEEEYWRDKNIPVSVTFSDGLAELSQVPFSDLSGNTPQSRISLLDGIVFCLQKTGLELEIWESIAIGETRAITTTANGVLNTTYFDPGTYLLDDGTMEDSLTVLKSLLFNIGAQISLSEGVWYIISPVIRDSSTRLYTNLGEYITDAGTDELDTMIDLKGNSGVNPKIQFINQTARKSHQELYGKLSFTFDYGLEGVNNILKSSDFVGEDAAAGQFKNWQATQSGYIILPTVIDPAEVDIISVVEDKENIFQVVFNNEDINHLEERYVTLEAAPIVLDEADFELKLSFDVRAMICSTLQVIPSTSQYAFFDYSIIVTDADDNQYILTRNSFGKYFIDSIFVFNDRLVEGEWMREFIDDSNQWKTVLCDNIRMSSSITYPATLSLRIRIARNRFYDMPIGAGTGLGGLRAVGTDGISDTPNVTINNRRRIQNINGSNVQVRTYMLEAGEEDDDGLNVIKPSDSDVRRWKLINNQYDQLNIKAWVSQFNVRRVSISYLPAGEEDELKESSTIDVTINANVKNTLALTFRHGDLEFDQNYKNIMLGWLSLSDGSPTELWKFRDSSVGPMTLQELRIKMYQGQYSIDRWKLSGQVLCNGQVPFLDKLVFQEETTDRYYRILSSSIQSKIPAATISMIEVNQGDEEPPVRIREHSTEFTTEFS